jgi:hypothetical protein
MTLSIASVTSSGIVLTADSRQTYSNNVGMTRIGTDNANKLFQITDKVGVVIAGKAFIMDDKNVLKSTGWYIQQFKKDKLHDKWTVKEIADNLNAYFLEVLVKPEEQRLKTLFTNDITTNKQGSNIVYDLRDNLKVHYSYLKDGGKIEGDFYIDPISLIVAGFDEDTIGRAYLVETPSQIKIDRNTEYGGPLWIGQNEIVARIVKGMSWELNMLPFVKNARESGEEVDKQLAGMEYIINWTTMTLQDAIDFCVLVTQITESIQRFSDGTGLHPDGITGVGGSVDVAAITAEEGFQWIQRKELTVDY